MSCCQRCSELCCPCLVGKHGDSKWAYIEYKPITTPSSPKATLTRMATIDAEDTPLPLPEKVFEFPQNKSEFPAHPQMFVGPSQLDDDNVITEQPKSQPDAYNIGRRRFSTLPRTSSVDSEHVVRGRANSLPQNTFIRKPNRKGRARAQSWRKEKSESFEVHTLNIGGSVSLPDLRRGKKSLLKRRQSTESDLVKGTAYSFCIPGLPVLEEESLTMDESRPLLQFSLQYDILRSSLTVHLHHACNLPAKDKRGTSDPFVVMYMMPNKEELFESKVVLQSLNPVFDESFEFQKLTSEDIRRQSLTLRIYDHDKFSKNDTIGGIVLPLENADLFGVVMRMEIDENPKLFSEDCSQGDLLLAMSYDSTSSCLKGVLLKATNLKKQDIMGLADPYVKIRLYYKDRLLAKWRSSIKRNTLVPVFNESFHFDLVGKDIKDIVMELLMMDYDRFSRDDFMGKLVFGSKVTGELELRHWQDMISASPQVISQWHSIKSQ